MPTNLELKVRYETNKKLSAGIQKLRARNAGVLLQTDTYFCFHPGRLKLREIEGSRSELIWYRRPNTLHDRYSDFKRISVKNAGSFKRILSAGIGVKTVVKKRRRLYLFRNARIHIDKVEKLGTFIEFEVMVTKGRNQARKLLSLLARTFEIKPRSILVFSYGDMMNRQEEEKKNQFQSPGRHGPGILHDPSAPLSEAGSARMTKELAIMQTTTRIANQLVLLSLESLMTTPQ